MIEVADGVPGVVIGDVTSLITDEDEDRGFPLLVVVEADAGVVGVCFLVVVVDCGPFDAVVATLPAS